MGGEVAVVRGLEAVTPVCAVDGLGVAGWLFALGRGVVADGGFKGEVRLSGLFTSVP